jgi:hypothetical protein
MRDHYDLKGGRPNLYAAKFGRKDRAALVRWWTTVVDNVRVLPKDLAREFPDTKSTIAALRLVVRLRRDSVKSARPKTRVARKRTSAGRAG